MPKSATKNKKQEPVSIDEKILAQYLANNPGVKVQEIDTGGNVVGDEQTLENFVNDINRSQPASTTPVSDTVDAIKSAAGNAAGGNGNTTVSGNGGSENVPSTNDNDTDEGGDKKSRIPPVTPGALAAPALNVVGGWTRGAGDWIASQPTPGGIGALLVAIFFLLWVLVPTSTGQTRMHLLYLTITGRTQLKDRAGYSLDGMTTAQPVTGAQEIPAGGNTSPQTSNGVVNPNLPNNFVDFSV